METWHYRLDYAMNARGKKWPELVEKTGLSKPSVYAWRPDAKKRSTMMDADNATIVCEWLGINHKWLFFGAGDSGLSSVPRKEAAQELPELARKIAERDVPSYIERAIMTLIEACPLKSTDDSLTPWDEITKQKLIEAAQRGGADRRLVETFAQFFHMGFAPSSDGKHGTQAITTGDDQPFSVAPQKVEHQR